MLIDGISRLCTRVEKRNRFYSLDSVFVFHFLNFICKTHSLNEDKGDACERYEYAVFLFNTNVWNNLGSSSTEHGFGFTCESHSKQTKQTNVTSTRIIS